MPYPRLIALLCLAGFAAAFQDAKDTSGADVDGPYIFEAGSESWLVKRVVRKDSGPAAAVEKLSGAAPEFDVPLPGRGKPLKVRLRPMGDPPASSVPAPERLLASAEVDMVVAPGAEGVQVDGDVVYAGTESGRLVAFAAGVAVGLQQRAAGGGQPEDDEREHGGRQDRLLHLTQQPTRGRRDLKAPRRIDLPLAVPIESRGVSRDRGINR